MAHVNCPFCGPNPVKHRSEYEALHSEEDRFKFMESICERCWDAILGNVIADYAKPVNEAEQLDGCR